jgi:hypothetical protein
VPYRVIPSEALALDLDDANDVERLLGLGARCPARDYLLRIGALDRLDALFRGGGA